MKRCFVMLIKILLVIAHNKQITRIKSQTVPNNYPKPFYDLNDAPQLFEKFIRDFRKVYKNGYEKQMHYEAFKKALIETNKFNYEDPKAVYGINNFSDYFDDQLENLQSSLKDLKDDENYNAPKPYYDVNNAPMLFEKFVRDYNKHYRDDNEKQFRYRAFQKTLFEINRLNKEIPASVFDINQFADLTEEEIQRIYYLSQKKSNQNGASSLRSQAYGPYPRTYGSQDYGPAAYAPAAYANAGRSGSYGSQAYGSGMYGK